MERSWLAQIAETPLWHHMPPFVEIRVTEINEARVLLTLMDGRTVFPLIRVRDSRRAGAILDPQA